MAYPNINNRFFKYCRQFILSNNANITILAAILMPVVVVIGAGSIDLYRVYNLKSSIQNISDSAVFSAMEDIAIKSPTLSATTYMRRRLVSLKRSDFDLVNTSSELLNNSTIIKLETKIKVKNYFLKLINVDTFDLSVISKAKSYCATQDAVYLGDSYINAQNEYVVTPNANYKKGFVWMKNKYNLDFRQNISLKLHFGDKDYRGADGMTFTIHNDKDGLNAIGTVGEALGVAWHPYRGYHRTRENIVEPAIVVEFDTWSNGDDMRNDHTAMFKLGGVGQSLNENTIYLQHRRPNSLMDAVNLGNIEDGKYHFARFIWDPKKKRIVYYFDGIKIGQKYIDIKQFLGSNMAYLGFTGTTGGYKNMHKACFLKVALTYE